MNIKRFACLIVLIAAAWTTQAAAPAGQVSQERWFVYASLLNTQDSDLIKLAAKGITRDSIVDLQLTDMAARILTEQLDGTRLINTDTTAWVAKALGASGSKRYSGVVEHLIAAKPGKIAEHATLALAQLTKPAPAFSPEDVDWTAIEADVVSTANSNRNDRRLHAASMGMSIEDVIKMLGYPTSVGTALHDRRASYASFSVNDLRFAFEGRGSVEFVHNGGEWRSSLISPELLPSQMADEGTVIAQVRTGLVGDDVREIRHVATILVHQKISDATTLDLAAWRLQRHIQAVDEYLVDGLAHIAVALGKTGNARYRPVLELAATQSATNKLKRRAKRALEDVPARDVEAFPGVFE